MKEELEELSREAVKKLRDKMDMQAVSKCENPGDHALIFKKWALTGQRRFQRIFAKDKARRLVTGFLNKLERSRLTEHAANYRSYLGKASNAALNTIPKWHIPRTMRSDDIFSYDMHERFLWSNQHLKE